MSNEKYGLLPMSMGKFLYAATKQRTQYELELMKFANEQAINYAEAYAGYDADGKLDAQSGVVGEYLSAANKAAENAGDVYRQDAINSLIQACVGTVAIVGTGIMYKMTSDSALDADIKDATAMQKDLNAPSKVDVEQQEEAENANKEQNTLTPAVKQKLDDWSEVGGSKFKNYEKLEKNLQGKELDEANANKELNAKAIEHAKSPEYKAKIQKNLDEYVKELNEQKRALSQKFNNFIQTANMIQPDLIAIGQTRQGFVKADDQTTADKQQAAAQVLNSAAQKQSSFIDTQQQEAQQFKQAADADAASYGQLQQTRGS